MRSHEISHPVLLDLVVVDTRTSIRRSACMIPDACIQGAKEHCERALEAKLIPLDVVTECLSLREGRREFEVVRDPVEHSLRREQQLVQEIRDK